MQKVGGKAVYKLVLKSGDFITTVQQKLIDSTLSISFNFVWVSSIVFFCAPREEYEGFPRVHGGG